MGAATEPDRTALPVPAGLAGRWVPAAVGVLGFGVGVAGAGRPSLWEDESATISASTRSLGELWNLLGLVDAVHGLYYLLMHFWFAVVPPTEFWSRLPSAIAVGLACAGLVVLGRQLSTRSFAIAAGIALAILPRATWAAIEARPYALAMCTAVWLTVLCVLAARRGRAVLWIGYALGLAITTVLNIVGSLVVLPHAVLVAGLVKTRRTALPWALAVLAAGLSTLPFAAAVQRQKGQADWIWPIGPGTLGQFIGDQYFPAVYSNAVRATGLDSEQQVTDEQIQATMQVWLLVVPYIVVLAVLAVWAIRKRRTAGAVIGADNGLLVRTAATWVLGPTIVLVLYSVVRDPIYVPHYLTFTAPGMALLIAWCVVVVGRDSRRIAIALIVLAVAAVPNYLAQRGPYAKFGMDYSQVGGLLRAHAGAGDCLNIDTAAAANLRKPIKSSKPEAFGRLTDPAQVATATEQDSLYELRAPATDWADRLAECAVLWTIADRDVELPAHETGAHLAPGAILERSAAHLVPAEHGFEIVERWQFNLTQVLRSVRVPMDAGR